MDATTGRKPDGTVDAATQTTVLCVDDEPNILSALRRLLYPHGYRVLLAGSGSEGLDIMGREPVDVVISDMRMPKMDGAEFLGLVAKSWPDTIRILLTGYADLDSTVAAINDGRIYRYISKPWEDNDLVVSLRRAAEFQTAERERRRLLDISQRQNQELRELNANLEQKVQARTEEIRQTAAFLEMAYGQLKRAYQDAIPVFANLIEMREGVGAGHARRVAELAREIAREMAIGPEEIEDIFNGALLHDIGTIGFSDALIHTPINALSLSQREQFRQHPLIGQAAIISLQPLAEAGRVIRSHHERYDGEGFPDHLAGDSIPLGARILAVANDYDALQTGLLVGRQMDPDEARVYIRQGRGNRYDPVVVEAFERVMERSLGTGQHITELKLSPADLHPGMIVTKDLEARGGLLLLARGRELTVALIDRLRALERDTGRGLDVYVQADDGNIDAAAARR